MEKLTKELLSMDGITILNIKNGILILNKLTEQEAKKISDHIALCSVEQKLSYPPQTMFCMDFKILQHMSLEKTEENTQ